MKRQSEGDSSSLDHVSEGTTTKNIRLSEENDDGEKVKGDLLSVKPEVSWTFTADHKQTHLMAEAELEYKALNGNTVPSLGLDRLKDSFYDVPCEVLAKALLGKVLVRCLDDGRSIKGRIVETESYLGGIDKASHSYNGNVTSRNIAMFMKPGTIYVYLTYGMYHCFNISSQGDGAAVLIRAVEPMEGHDYMHLQRITMRKTGFKTPDSYLNSKPKWKLHELCNGPSKLSRCFNIDRDLCNKRDLCLWDGLWIEADEDSKNVEPHCIVTSTRVGIEGVGSEWASKPLRFYILGNKSVSRVDKKAEQLLHDADSV